MEREIARQFYKIFDHGKGGGLNQPIWAPKMVSLLHMDPTHGPKDTLEAQWTPHGTSLGQNPSTKVDSSLLWLNSLSMGMCLLSMDHSNQVMDCQFFLNSPFGRMNLEAFDWLEHIINPRWPIVISRHSRMTENEQ